MSEMGFTPGQQRLPRGFDALHPSRSSEVLGGSSEPGLIAVPSVIGTGLPLRHQAARPSPPDGPGPSGMVAPELRRHRAAPPLSEAAPTPTRPQPRIDIGAFRLHHGGAAGSTGQPEAADARGVLRRLGRNDSETVDTDAAAPPAAARRTDGPGLPGALQAGLEELSGLDLSDVRIRYDSPEPARRHALAFANGTDIEVGPGQEKHLAHEGWHVVQQKQGRVTSSMLMKGAPVNADPRLEHEADVMGARAAALHGETNHHDGPDPTSRSPRYQASIAAPTMQLKGEKEFMKDPSAFMDSNQVLVSFDEGVQQTYALPPGMIEKIKARQDALAEDALKKVKERREKDTKSGKKLVEDDYGFSIAMAQDINKPESIKRKGDNFLTQLMSEAMAQVKCTLFTLATRTVQTGFFGFGGTTQYIVTPFLESLERAIPEDVMTTAPDGTELPLSEALSSLKRTQTLDGVIQAAYIPYESNPNLVTAETSVDVPIDGDIKLAFTAAMNGCSLAIKKKSDTEMTVWHFPSPDSSPEVWKTFKEENGIDATYDWSEYNGLSNDERVKLLKNHVTTTVMIRDDEGWSIKSQQNVGPEGGKQQTDLLKLGKVFGRRLHLGEEVNVDVVDGEAETHDK